jgi:hypothetical protein
MPHENIQLRASLLQYLSTSEYNRHRSIHHAISLFVIVLNVSFQSKERELDRNLPINFNEEISYNYPIVKANLT